MESSGQPSAFSIQRAVFAESWISRIYSFELPLGNDEEQGE